ncbi:hypothetical protein ACF1GT_36075 [Streptomyces sp. NPDC014636]|uniref:hypothetical protein n=1 Tax=Streptomyces sp. NPDC014636 TaxID=3364876 RepID=UPI003700418E
MVKPALPVDAALPAVPRSRPHVASRTPPDGTLPHTDHPCRQVRQRHRRLFEGTNVSEGRGTTQPFEIVGAPYVDARFAPCLAGLVLGGQGLTGMGRAMALMVAAAGGPRRARSSPRAGAGSPAGTSTTP